MISKGEFHIFDVVKFFLILGVVSIHSNVLVDLSVSSAILQGYQIVEFLSTTLTKICVPGFYIISGFLFFNNNTFSRATYFNKIHRRIYTLLIPYLIWNIISLALRIYKIEFLGFPSYGLIEHHQINLMVMAEGFFNYEEGYPFAFAFWFIRNLMIFVLLSPIAYLIGNKNYIICILFIITCCVFNTTLWGFSFFIIGAALARFFNLKITPSRLLTSLCGIIWVVIAVFDLYMDFNYLSSTILYLETLSALLFLYYSTKNAISSKFMSIVRSIVPATFFIYAFHQLFCSVTRTFFIKFFGLETNVGVLLSYLFSLITLVGVSYLVWKMLKIICPRVLNILCGNRAN